MADSQSPSFSEVLAEGIARPHIKITSFLKMTIIPPFTKQHFKSNASFEAASKKTIVDILSSFKPHHRDQITISKAFSTVKEKRLHSLIVIAPTEAEDDLTIMKTEGLQLLDKTIFPTGDHFWRYDPNGFPKTAMLRMNQVPGLCDDEAVLEALQLPPTVHVEGEVTRQREKCGQGSFFNGKASAIIRIPNESAETDLRQWSFNAVKTRPLKWLDLPFNAHVPSIHSCSLCKEEKKPYIGHSWCRIRRQQPPEVNQTTSNLATSNSADGTPASEGRMDEEDWHVMKARSSLRRSGAFSRQKSQRRHSSPDAEKQTPSKLQKREQQRRHSSPDAEKQTPSKLQKRYQQVSSLKTSHT